MYSLLLLALTGFALTLIRHILFKRALYKLKQDMQLHKKEHGNDEALWTLFNSRTEKMLRFWQ
ncbi:hypothetical protein AB4562_00650 [Vibrio sp. 10N.222.54.A1]|uniref:Uncharacterized protein n=3 Tax=Vibrio cyclitrophicus TaxID=47951 RepID=A0A7Z1S0X5_9VIBR|nr:MULTISPECIES: hypothetical protein [Vibrio]PMK82303.1 hypothetical protein BCT92_13815 [Vibrio sp. 10N.261.52.E5]PMP22840.1 hypothetical protein BCS91_15790 [Vibrio cyclitrophicus]PMP24871.1 hypothetical protein BCS90_24925 [Vibrio cyclitrophicus]TKF84918.1 hypothetical protein FCV65_04220 [Vibrio sp. F13]TKG00437.1 hypothetical protein FCV67_23200 [Vibrio sp. F13]